MSEIPLKRYSATLQEVSYAALLLIIPTAALLLLWPAVSGPFIFDDFPNLQNLREIGDHLTRESIGRYLAAWQGNPGRPLATLSFLIEDHGWPTDPEAFKRNNLLWHLLVGIGIFALARKLARLYANNRSNRLDSNARDSANWIALAAMVFWLVHPMQLSATMLVVQRMTILSNGLIVSGLLVYIAILGRRTQPTVLTAIIAVGTLGTFGALAFLAKENGPLIFAYATALNLTLAAPLINRFPALPRKVLWLGTAGMTALLVAGLLWQVRDFSSAYAARDFSLVERLLTQPRILFDYVADILLPRMSTGIFYDDYLISRKLLTPWTTLPALVGLVGALAAAVFYRHRFPLFAFAVLWFLAGHLIESTVIPLELYFEHRNYLAMLGPVMAVIIPLSTAGGDLRKPLRIALIAWLGLTAAIGHYTARSWGDELAQAELWVLERPDSTRAVQTLASAYVKLGFFDGGSRILQRGAERIPDADELEFQQALLACISGDATDQTFTQLIKLAESASWARVIPDVMASLRGHASAGRCNGTLTPVVYRNLILALLDNPDFRWRSETVGYLRNELGMLYLDIDQPELALEQFRRSFEARPDPQLAINEANIAIYLGRFDYAQEALKRAQDVKRPLFQKWLYPLDERLHRARSRVENLRKEHGSAR